MREVKSIEGVPWTLTKITVANLPKRELFCALLNGEGFAAEQEKIAEGGW